MLTHPRHDYMLDHEQVHLLARSAAFAYPMPNASSLPLIAGSAVPWLYYSDPLEVNDPYTGKPAESSVLVDVSSVNDLKVAMLASHVSQREWLRKHHGVDEFIDSMNRQSNLRGQQMGVPHAESFLQHRGHPFPQSDIIHALLGKE